MGGSLEPIWLRRAGHCDGQKAVEINDMVINCESLEEIISWVWHTPVKRSLFGQEAGSRLEIASSFTKKTPQFVMEEVTGFLRQMGRVALGTRLCSLFFDM